MEQYSSMIPNSLEQIARLQAQIEALQPISEEQKQRIFQKYRLDWNYHSNSIEGNSLNYGETVAFIMEGLTAKGKPLKDHLDIRGHNQAIDFLLALQERDAELTERDIRELHELILVEPYQAAAETADGLATTKTIQLGRYKSSPNHVRTATGEIHYYATPEETPAKMHDLMTWYRENKPTMHPLILSALFHHRFVSIHPFDDGNGRMARLLSNLILMQAGYPPVVIRQDEKGGYYGVLSQADVDIEEPLLEYFAERLVRSLDTYLKGARGEDFSDSNDLDKEIALLKASFSEDFLSRRLLSETITTDTFTNTIRPLFTSLVNYGARLDDLFFSHSIAISMVDKYGTGSALHNGLSSNFAVQYKVLEPQIAHIVKHDREKGDAIRGIKLTYTWHGLKSNDAGGPISKDIYFYFHKYEYNILTKDDSGFNLLFSNSYPKQMTQEEISSVVSKYIKKVIAEIRVMHEAGEAENK